MSISPQRQKDLALEKYTLQPRSAQILELLGTQILSSVDENDLQNIATPTVCRKYVIVLADRIKEEMKRTQFYVVDRSIPVEGQETVLYKYTENQQPLCNSFAFYIARILQLIYLCMSHVSTGTTPGIEGAAVAAPAGTAPAAAAGESRNFANADTLSAFIGARNKRLVAPNLSKFAVVLAGSVDGDQSGSTGAEDPRIFIEGGGNEYRYWMDAATLRIGFTKDNKNYYMDFLPAEFRQDAQRPGGGRDNAIILIPEASQAKDGKTTAPYFLFANGQMFQTRNAPGRDRDRDRGGRPELTEVYRQALFKSIADRISKARADATDDSGRLFPKKTTEGPTAAVTTGAIIFSNPLYAFQNAMISSRYVEGGFTYTAGNLNSVRDSLKQWIVQFIDIAFSDAFDRITSKDGKTYSIEKGKIKWQLVQRPTGLKRAARAQEIRVTLDTLFTQIGVIPGLTPDTLMVALGNNSRGWQQYYYCYKQLTAMQTQMAQYATTMLFTGAAGLPPLVLWETTDRGRRFRVNSAIVNVGSAGVEKAFDDMGETMFKLYSNFLKLVAATSGSVKTMISEMPAAAPRGGAIAKATVAQVVGGIRTRRRVAKRRPRKQSRKH